MNMWLTEAPANPSLYSNINHKQKNEDERHIFPFSLPRLRTLFSDFILLHIVIDNSFPSSFACMICSIFSIHDR
jgi:hypothetical protein